MRELKKIVRWIRVASFLQSTLIFLIHFIFARRVSAIADELRDSLYQSGVAVAQVKEVNNAVDSLAATALWIFLAGILLTVIAYAALEGLIKRRWSNPILADREGS
jgi:hypothetical protein